MREYWNTGFVWRGFLAESPDDGGAGGGAGEGAAATDLGSGDGAAAGVDAGGLREDGGAGADAADEGGPQSELEAVKAALAGVEKPAAPAAEQPKGVAQRKPAGADPDFTPPRGITPEATARFSRLVERTKAAEGAARTYEQIKPEYEELKAAQDDLRTLFREHHVEPERFSALMGYQRLIGEGDLKGARAALFSELKKLSLEIGDHQEAPDPLSDHEDLLSDVENASMSRERAIELARARSREAERTQREQQSRQATNSVEQSRQVADRATSDIAAWAAELRKSDINFVVKEKQIVGLIDGIVQEYPPNLWLPTLKRVYDSMKAGPSGNGQAADAGVRPLRSSGGQQVSREPKSELDAVRLALRGTLQ